MSTETKQEGESSGLHLPDAIRDKLPGMGPKLITVKRVLTVARPASELYAQWRDLSSHPRWMTHLESVTETSPTRSHWVARLPGSERLEWDAETTADVPNERIAWQTLADAPVRHAGEVRFKAAPGGRGTEVNVTLELEPPGGTLGAAVATLFDEVTAESLENEVRHFKQLMETGEIPTTDGQPTGNTGEKGEKE